MDEFFPKDYPFSFKQYDYVDLKSKILELIDGITQKGNIVGMDLVEVAPDYDLTTSTTTLAAQLLLNAIGRILYYRKN